MSNDWRIITNGDDWMRSTEKRIARVERRVGAGQAQSTATPSATTNSASVLRDFPSIPAFSTSELTVMLSGAEVGNMVAVTPVGAIEAGLMWCGYVSGPGVVTIRVANVTNAAIDPAARTWGVDVWS